MKKYTPKQEPKHDFLVTGFGSRQEDFLDESHTDLTPIDLVSDYEYSYDYKPKSKK